MNLCIFRDYIENCKKCREYPSWEGLKKFYYKSYGGNKDG